MELFSNQYDFQISYLLFDKPFNKSVVIRFIISAWFIQINFYMKDIAFNTGYRLDLGFDLIISIH